eukprot:1143766-Pleurochrysis_carterae.AAC.4
MMTLGLWLCTLALRQSYLEQRRRHTMHFAIGVTLPSLGAPRLVCGRMRDSAPAASPAGDSAARGADESVMSEARSGRMRYGFLVSKPNAWRCPYLQIASVYPDFLLILSEAEGVTVAPMLGVGDHR